MLPRDFCHACTKFDGPWISAMASASARHRDRTSTASIGCVYVSIDCPPSRMVF
jgi:hypothetical protein